MGIVLAAGAGSRLGLGYPKALVADTVGRTWLVRAVTALRDGGVLSVSVVVGADAAVVERAAPQGCTIIRAQHWQDGMSASLRAALVRLSADQHAEAAVVMLVDTPGVGSEVVRRLLKAVSADSVVRAAYDGVSGHPVVIGRSHWRGVLDTAVGDRGARDYLRTVDVDLIECADIGSGADIDTPAALSAWLRPPADPEVNEQ